MFVFVSGVEVIGELTSDYAINVFGGAFGTDAEQLVGLTNADRQPVVELVKLAAPPARILSVSRSTLK